MGDIGLQWTGDSCVGDALATDSEAQAGLINFKLMTPSSTSAAITSLSSGGASAVIETIDFSSDTSWDISLDTSTYDIFKIFIKALIPATNETTLQFRVSDDNAATYETSNYDYAAGYIDMLSTTPDGEAFYLEDAQNAIPLNASGNRIGNAAGDGGWSGEITITNAELAKSQAMHWQGSWGDGIGKIWSVWGSGRWDVDTAITHVRFLMSSGNIASGSGIVIGYKNA